MVFNFTGLVQRGLLGADQQSLQGVVGQEQENLQRRAGSPSVQSSGQNAVAIDRRHCQLGRIFLGQHLAGQIVDGGAERRAVGHYIGRVDFHLQLVGTHEDDGAILLLVDVLLAHVGRQPHRAQVLIS